MRLSARDVRVTEDEYEAEVSFVWSHPTREWDCLSFQRPWPPVETAHGPSPIWVSRRAPFHSGCPGIIRFSLRRGAADVHFTGELASRLQLEQEVSIAFELADEWFNEVRRALSRVFEGCAWYAEPEAR